MSGVPHASAPDAPAHASPGDLTGGGTLWQRTTAAITQRFEAVKSAARQMSAALRRRHQRAQAAADEDLQAVWAGDACALATLLENGGEIKWSALKWTRSGWAPPLHYAARHGHTAVAKLLLGAGGRVNSRTEDGETALFFATMAGHTDTVEMLLQAGADVEGGASRHGYRPLNTAACCGELELVKLLCSHGARRTGGEGKAAAKRGHLETAAWLAATADYTTTLHYVALDLVPPTRARVLLRAGASLHAGRAGGATPLSLARELEAQGKAPSGSTAWLILRAAGPWTRETHGLFPDKRRAEACSLVFSICHIHARRCVGTGFPEMQDFAALVLKYAITR